MEEVNSQNTSPRKTPTKEKPQDRGQKRGFKNMSPPSPEEVKQQKLEYLDIAFSSTPRPPFITSASGMRGNPRNLLYHITQEDPASTSKTKADDGNMTKNNSNVERTENEISDVNRNIGDSESGSENESSQLNNTAISKSPEIDVFETEEDKCPNCNEKADMETIQCDSCKLWVHQSCENLSGNQSKMIGELHNIVKWYCVSCNKRITNLIEAEGKQNISTDSEDSQQDKVEESRNHEE